MTHTDGAADDAVTSMLNSVLRVHFPGGVGAAVAFVSPDGSCSMACIGSDSVGGAPVTPDTLFELASTTKWLTAATALRLCEQGLLALDEAVGEHLATFSTPTPTDRSITLRDLLQHTSGLADYLESGIETDPSMLSRSSIDARLADWVAAARPGLTYSYSNTNYHVVAEVIDQVHAGGFRTAMRELFHAAGMSATGFGDELLSRPAEGVRNVGLVEADLVPVEDLVTDVVGDGGAYSTLRDLCRWVHAFTTGEVIGADSSAEMTRPGVLYDGTTFDYGLGVELQRRGHHVIGFGHSGSWTNSTTCVLVDAVSGRGVVVLSNQFMAPVLAVAQSILAAAG